MSDETVKTTQTMVAGPTEVVFARLTALHSYVDVLVNANGAAAALDSQWRVYAIVAGMECPIVSGTLTVTDRAQRITAMVQSGAILELRGVSTRGAVAVAVTAGLVGYDSAEVATSEVVDTAFSPIDYGADCTGTNYSDQAFADMIADMRATQTERPRKLRALVPGGIYKFMNRIKVYSFAGLILQGVGSQTTILRYGGIENIPLDAPLFTRTAGVTTIEAGDRQVFSTNIVNGDESEPSLFSVQRAVSAGDTLTVTPDNGPTTEADTGTGGIPVVIDASDGSYTRTDGGSFIADGFEREHMVTTIGFTNYWNNVAKEIISVSANRITVSPYGLTDETLATARLVVGTSARKVYLSRPDDPSKMVYAGTIQNNNPVSTLVISAEPAYAVLGDYYLERPLMHVDSSLYCIFTDFANDPASGCNMPEVIRCTNSIGKPWNELGKYSTRNWFQNITAGGSIDANHTGNLAVGLRFGVGAITVDDSNNDFHTVMNCTIANQGDTGFAIEGTQAYSIGLMECYPQTTYYNGTASMTALSLILTHPGTADFGYKDINKRVELAGAGAQIATTGSTALSIVGDTLTIHRAAGDFVADGFKAGQAIVTTGFTNAANNGRWTINTVTASDIQVTDFGFVTEAAGGNETVVANARYCGYIKRVFPELDQLQMSVAADTTVVNTQFQYGGQFGVRNATPPRGFAPLEGGCDFTMIGGATGNNRRTDFFTGIQGTGSVVIDKVNCESSRAFLKTPGPASNNIKWVSVLDCRFSGDGLIDESPAGEGNYAIDWLLGSGLRVDHCSFGDGSAVPFRMQLLNSAYDGYNSRIFNACSFSSSYSIANMFVGLAPVLTNCTYIDTTLGQVRIGLQATPQTLNGATTLKWGGNNTIEANVTADVTVSFDGTGMPFGAGEELSLLVTWAGAFTITWPGTVTWLTGPRRPVSLLALFRFRRAVDGTVRGWQDGEPAA